MSYLGSVSQTLTVEVMLPIHTLDFYIIESNPAGNIFPGGTIEIDGISYNISPETAQSIQLEAGTHTIQVIVPSGYEFFQWSSGGNLTIDNTNVNPTGFTTSGDAGIFGWIRQIVITTALTLNLAETPPVAPSSTLTFTGNLSAPDLGAGIGGVPILLESPPGTPIATGTTDGNGNYSIPVTAPPTVGTYSYRTSFAGITGLAAAQSPTMGIGVGVADEGIGIAALAAIAAAVWTIFKK